MQTNYDVVNDAGLEAAARDLLVAARRYWEEYRRALAASDAVVWLQGDQGELVIFTRGEYKATLMQNIEHQREELRFG